MQMKARLTLIVARVLVVVLALSGQALAATSPLVSAPPVSAGELLFILITNCWRVL